MSADGAFIGGGAAVHQTVRIGRLAMVSGLAGVTNDIPPFGYVFGLPARLVGFNKIGLLRRGATRDQLRTLRAANATCCSRTPANSPPSWHRPPPARRRSRW